MWWHLGRRKAKIRKHRVEPTSYLDHSYLIVAMRQSLKLSDSLEQKTHLDCIHCEQLINGQIVRVTGRGCRLDETGITTRGPRQAHDQYLPATECCLIYAQINASGWAAEGLCGCTCSDVEPRCEFAEIVQLRTRHVSSVVNAVSGRAMV